MRKILSCSPALAFLVLASCITDAPDSEAEGTRSEASAGALDPARPADRQMLAFGGANTDCPLWTNWQKLCSRTGPNGRPHCSTDSHAVAEPSAPFCARQLNVTNQEERASSERYCTQRDLLNGVTPICVRHEPSRPFNGRRIGALIHSWCQTWSDALSREPVCTTGGDSRRGIPDCAQLARTNYEHPRRLICGGLSASAQCPVRESRAAVGDDGGEADVVIDRPIPIADGAPAHGFICE